MAAVVNVLARAGERSGGREGGGGCSVYCPKALPSAASLFDVTEEADSLFFSFFFNKTLKGRNTIRQLPLNSRFSGV